MRGAALLALLALAVSACGAPDTVGGPSPTDPGDIEAPWQLESGAHQGGEIPIIDSHPITMTLDGERFGGTAACNEYGGSYRLSAGTITIDLLGVTEMACQPARVMRSEQRFLEALGQVEQVELVDGALVVSGPTTELRFTRLEPVPTAELIGTVWVLDGLVQGDSVTSPVTGSEPATLELFADGSFAGSTGCRTISGIYQVTGAEVQFTDWGAEGECIGRLRRQDGRVISALEGGFRVEIDGDRMTTWISGDEGLIYRARD